MSYNKLMLLTNHVLTGTLLGLTIDNPVLLAPAAVGSHLLLDMTPHFGYHTAKGNFRAPFFLIWGALDFAASVTVVAAACVIWPQRAANILIGAVGAALPDLVYIPITLFGERRVYRLPGYAAMIRFLSHIQWYEKPPGLLTEAVWASLMLYLLGKQL
jgi:hypothetical protein